MEFHLDEEIFKIVKCGTKHIEVRLNDEKRRNLKIGDNLIFINRSNEDKKIIAVIKGLKYFDNFNDLANSYDIAEIYKKDSTTNEFLELLEKFYSKEEIEKYGVVAIDFEMREKSCGIMVFKDDSVLLVHHLKGHWGFPKGHVEKDETEFETAIREVKEETNVDARIIGDFRSVITYSPKPNTLKDVVFFIGEAETFDLKPQLEEASEVKYVSINEALNLINDDVKDLLINGYNAYNEIKKINC